MIPLQGTRIIKEDLKILKEEIILEFHLGAEIISGELRLLAEKILTLNEKIERFRQEFKDELENKTQPIFRHCDRERLQL
jgi:hypothetical protein